MNNYDIICHRKNPLLGSEKEDHKYVARVLIKRTSKGNQYKYFYDNKEYQKYLKTKGNGSKVQKATDSTNKASNTTNVKIASSSKKNLVEKGRKAVQKDSNKSVNSLFISYSLVKKVNDLLKISVKKAGEKIDDMIYTKKEREEDKQKQEQQKQEQQKQEQQKQQEQKNKDSEERNNLTVTLPNGKTKKFDNVDEYDDYKERLAHQENEPDFMKNVPDIADTDIFTKFEDQSKVNETYDYENDRTSTNCSNCSIAYELRRRGYDVEALANGGTSEYNGNFARHYDNFENAKVIAIYGDGSTLTHTEEFMKDYFGDDLQVNLKTKHDEQQFAFNESKQSYTSKSLEKGITDNSPPGSRGMIDVVWKDGGAHSIVYEVDSKGKVTIRDSQTYDEYSLDELASEVSSVRICRTDNLKLKENVLKAVTPNKDKKRKYYVDEGYIRYYRK